MRSQRTMLVPSKKHATIPDHNVTQKSETRPMLLLFFSLTVHGTIIGEERRKVTFEGPVNLRQFVGSRP